MITIMQSWQTLATKHIAEILVCSFKFNHCTVQGNTWMPVFKHISLNKEIFWSPYCSTRWSTFDLHRKKIDFMKSHERVKTFGEEWMIFAHPSPSLSLYVSWASWQIWLHSSFPLSAVHVVLSAAPPPPRPRLLERFLDSSPFDAELKWGTNKQQRKWLAAADRLDVSTPWATQQTQFYVFFTH